MRKLLQSVAVVFAVLLLVSTGAMAAEMPCTRADDHGCTMAKGGNGEDMKVTAPGAKVGEKMHCDEKGTCTKQLMQ